MLETKLKREYIIYAVIVLIFSFFLVLKMFVTTENSFADETIYITIASRFINGDVMLVHEWSAVQTGSLLLVPFVWIWNLFSSGNNDGIILYFRMIYLLFKLFVLLYSIHLTKDKPYRQQAFIAGLLYYFFTPQNIEAISYNTLGLGMIYLVILMILADRGRTRDYIICGLAFTIVVFVQPYNLLLYIAYVLCVFGILTYRKVTKRNCEVSSYFSIKGLCWFSLGPVICVLLLVFYLFSNASIQELILGVQNALGDPDHASTEGFFRGCCHRILHNVDTFAKDYILVTLINCIWTVWLIINRLKRRYFIKSTLFVLVFSFLGIMVIEKSFPMNIVYYAFFWFAIDEFIIMKEYKLNHILCMLIALGYAIGVSLGTNTGVISAGAALAALGLISVVLWTYVQRDVDNTASNRIYNISMFSVIILAIFVMRILLVWTEVYSPSIYSAYIERGPMKGTWTREEVRDSYYRDLDAMDLVNCNEDDVLLCGRITPVTYLYTQAEVGIMAVNFFDMHYDMLDNYFEHFPNKVPTVIYYSSLNADDIDSRFLIEADKNYEVYDFEGGFLARKK